MTAAERRELTEKARATRARILESALRLFREEGFEGTTMRGVAREARVSLGNAYYYFRSKEHLVQGFYEQSHDEHLAACDGKLEQLRDFESRLRFVVRSKIDTSQPYHRFAGILFKTAADPYSPLNPFSPESEAVRQRAVDLMAEVVEDCDDLRLRSPLRRELPHLLWLYEMGVILFWVHDHSAGGARTRKLVEATVPMVASLVKAMRFPLVRELAARVVELLADLRRIDAGPAPAED